MTKIVYSDSFCGFSISRKAYEKLKAMKSKAVLGKSKLEAENSIARHDPDLVKVVEELGAEAQDCDMPRLALAIHTITGNRYMIKEYDGLETVIEPDDIDWIIVS